MGVESVVESGKRLLAGTFLDSCTIKRPTRSTDGGGGVTESLVVVAPAVACRFGVPIDPLPNREVDTIYGIPTASILFPLGTNVKENDHVVNAANGDVWLVIGDKTPASAMAVCTRVNVREI